MRDEYDGSFYYENSRSIGTEISGEAAAASIGLGIGIIGISLTVIAFIVSRIDLLSSLLLGLLFYMLTYTYEWPKSVYITAVIVIVVGSMLLQHFLKVFRIIYTLFTCVIASILGPILIGYDSDAKMYLIMAICFGVTAIWGFLSWRNR